MGPSGSRKDAVSRQFQRVPCVGQSRRLHPREPVEVPDRLGRVRVVLGVVGQLQDSTPTRKPRTASIVTPIGPRRQNKSTSLNLVTLCTQEAFRSASRTRLFSRSWVLRAPAGTFARPPGTRPHSDSSVDCT